MRTFPRPAVRSLLAHLPATLRVAPALTAAAALFAAGCGDSSSPAPKPPAAATQPAKPASPEAGAAGNPVAPVKPAATAPAPQQAAAAPTAGPSMEEGLAKIDELTQAGDFKAAVGLGRQLQDAMPDHPKIEEVTKRVLFLNEARRNQDEFDFAISQLTGAGSSVAESRLRRGGEAAAILLRKALLKGDDAQAKAAGTLLAEINPKLAGGAIATRILAAPTSETAAALAKSIGPAAAYIPPADLARLAAAVGEPDAGYTRRAVVLALASAFDAPGQPGITAPAAPAAAPAAPEPVAPAGPGFNGDIAKFNAAAGADTHRKLCLYIWPALTDKDPAVALWALDLATRLRFARPGLAAHFNNNNPTAPFNLDRIDEALLFPDPQSFKMPGGRLEYFDGRFDATLLVPTAGKYTFEAAVDDGVRIWIDGNAVLGTAAALVGTGVAPPIDLTAGPHSFRVDYSQGPSGAALGVYWTGPGIEKRVIDKSVTRAINPAATQPAATSPATPAAAAPAAPAEKK